MSNELIKYRGKQHEFVVEPEPEQQTDWLDSFMCGVMTLGLCGTITLLILIALKNLLRMLVGV